MQKATQSDFGKIYFNLPKETHQPKTTEELATTLKHLNAAGKKVRVRNAGHSVNGQTLTDQVQINIGEIKQIHFDEKKLQVTVGAGNTWDEILKGIGFPNFCLPLFPTNPGQKIKIGGSASVGGIGTYSSKAGGFWNHVIKIKLVTMGGEIIECSREKNVDLLKFALGGFGRIGIITELTIKVVPSKNTVLFTAFVYKNFESYYNDLQILLRDGQYDSIIGLHEISYAKILSTFKISPYTIVLAKEVDSVKEAKDIDSKLKKKFHPSICLYGEEKGTSHTETNFSFKFNTLQKKDLVYFYPEHTKKNQLGLSHPWGDYVVDENGYKTFIEEVNKLLKKYDVAKYIMKESAFHNLIDCDMLISYCIKNLYKEQQIVFPLSLDISTRSDFSYDFGIMPSVPQKDIESYKKLHTEIADLVFNLNGKVYLYGYHNLNKLQIEKQYGHNIIQEWQKLKDQHDPKHLLNIGVIEHLDD